MDYEWQQAIDTEDCNERKRMARKIDSIRLSSRDLNEVQISYPISQVGSPHVWYFALIDCSNNDPNFINDNVPVVADVKIVGVEGTHFSHDEIGLLPFSVIFSIILGACLVYSIYKCAIDSMKMEKLDYPSCFLIGSIFLQFCSLFCDSIYLTAYSINGEGIKFFHILSIILEIGSQFIMTTIIMMFAMGWAVTNRQMIETKKLVSIISAGLFIHLLLAGLTNPLNDMYNKFHEFEGIQGFLLISLRLGIFAFSLYSLNETKKVCTRRQHSFISWFGYIGSLYQLAFPFMIILGMIFVPYLRYRIVKFGNLFVQIISLILMTNLLTGKNEYYKLSTKSLTQLPGFKNY